MNNKSLKLANQICFPIYLTSRLVTKTYKPFLDKMGITYPQYLVLLVLWECNNLSVTQIKEKLHLDTNTLSPMLSRMEKLKLIKKSKSHIDARNVIIQLNEKGKALKKQANLIPKKLLEALIDEKVSLSEIKELKNMLNELTFILSSRGKN
jgi:DNA-binding MarR family transcriptional regulator